MSPACGSAMQRTSRLKSGVTVVVCDEPAVAGVQVLGGAPGTRETDLLEPHNSVADGQCDRALRRLRLRPRRRVRRAGGVARSRASGFEVRGHRIPIVPAASCSTFTMAATRTGAAIRPIANSATMRRRPPADFAIGTAGAGTGALTAGLKGGLGSASTVLDNGITIGALAAVNADGLGDGRRSTPFLGRALRDRRRIRRPRLSLADAVETPEESC